MSSDDARRMAQLLRRMTGGDGGGQGRDQQRQRLQALAKKMTEGDDSDQYVALTEFCETLNMATEDVMVALRAEDFVPPITQCLQKEYNVELMLLAARSLTYLIDAIPPAAVIVATTGGIPILCDKLRNILDIDLAEQALTAIAKISTEVPGEVLRNDGVSALLGFIDFFSISVQRKSVACVANLCRRCGTKYFDAISGSLPALHNFIQHEDAKISESALLAILRVLQGVREDEEKLTIAFGDLTPMIIEILDKRACDASFTNALKILSTVVSCSANISGVLLEFGLIFTLQSLIEPAGGEGGSVGGGTPSRSPALGPATPSPIKGAPGDSSSEASPLGGTSGGNSPFSLGVSSTPPSASRLTSTAKALSTDQTLEVCHTITQLLPKVQDDYMLYWGPRQRLLAAAGSAASAPAPHHPGRPTADDEDEGEEDLDEEEEEEELTDEEVKSRLADFAESGDINITNDAKHKSCKVGNHSCDFCGAGSLKPEDWYRCNEMTDFDSCARCMYYNGASFCQAEGKTFTAMDQLLGTAKATTTTTSTEGTSTAAKKPQPAEASGISVPSLPVREKQTTPRDVVFQESPHLLQRVCEISNILVRFCRDSEHPQVRVNGLDFISRMVYAADAETLRTLLTDVPLCDYLRSCFEVADGNLQLLPPLCYVCRVLLNKLGDVYHELFVREGIVHALTKVQMHDAKGGGSAPSSPTQANAPSALRPLNELCATEQGWHHLLAVRAAEMLKEFQNEGSSKVVSELEELGQKFAAGSTPWVQCLREFEQIYSTAASISTFELVTSNIIHHVLEGLRKHPNAVVAMVDMFAVLSRREASMVFSESTDGISHAEDTPLFKLVQQLHTVLSQFENFPALTTGGLRSVSSQIRLKLAPDPTMEKAAAEAGKKPAETEGSTGGSPPPPPPPPKKNMGASVNIEPLATIGAVADFIQSRLLSGASAGAKKPQDENQEAEAEEILPETAGKEVSTGKSGKKAAGAAAEGPVQVYIRLNGQTLRHNLSMVQVLQRYVQPTEDKDGKGKKEKAKERNPAFPPGLPKHLQDAFLMATRSDVDEIELYYSTSPFPEAVAKPAEGRATAEDLKSVQLDTKSLTHGSSQVSLALSQPLRCSTALDTPLPSMVRDCLTLLRVLHAASASWSTLAQYCHMVGFTDVETTMESAVPLTTNAFINQRLNQKLMRQVTNPLFAGQLEDTWCVYLMCDCPFLFPASSRKFLFDITFHGTARALSRVADRAQEMGEPQPTRNNRIQRHKMRVSRESIIDCARRIDELYGTSRLVFEMEFYGEEGSGLGPTLEYYTLVGKALQKKNLKLWRESEDDDGSINDSEAYHTTVHGLFPRPSLDTELVEECKMFRFLGRLIGRAVLDRRILNLRLSRPLLKLLRGDAVVLDDIAMISTSLYDILFAMQSARGKSGPPQIDLSGSRSVNVSDLCLNFVLSGKEDLPLVSGGQDKDVTFETMGEYVDRTVSLLLKTGIEKQVGALREGFDELVPVRSLQLLQLEDLAEMLSGHEEVVTMEELEAHTVQDHGFTPSSPPVRMLFEVLTAMSLDEQRLFFQFLTGSPRLPVGGLASLRPKLTIVRKTSSSNTISEQDQLPSAMTCQNFLKLPAYESKAQLEAKLSVAIHEGRNGFNFT